DDLVTGVQTCALPIWGRGGRGFSYYGVHDAAGYFVRCDLYGARAGASVGGSDYDLGQAAGCGGVSRDDGGAERAGADGGCEGEEIGRASCRERGESWG